jgi:uncharacterized protein YdhG (YjbR/CyaY superfamily)
MAKAKDVDQYIRYAPQAARAKLKELRNIIKQAVPEAEEKISYSMPYYGYYGRLAYFGLAKNHVGLYLPPPVIAEYKTELIGYKTSIAAIQFPLDKKLPVALIKKLVKARAKKNRAASQKKR